MKFKLKRNATDKTMVEVWFEYGRKPLLACVMHEDCIDEEDISQALEHGNEAEIEITLVSA
jgi:hypothetical protein